MAPWEEAELEKVWVVSRETVVRTAATLAMENSAVV
jgi:hypothetical protein